MSCSKQPFLFFVKCPDLTNLLSFSVVCNNEKQLPAYHQRILKCRELIFSELEIVATPSRFSSDEIIAIILKTRFYNPDFQKKLDKMGLSVLKIDATSPTVLQECLQYTTTAKLAPQWNNVQNLLVQGRDFLMTSDPLRAIKLDVFANEEEITLSVTPTCIKLPPFRIGSSVKIQGSSADILSMDESCHVLPSLKKGNVISLSKSNLNRNVFKTYSDIKKHWKNMYGYRLPEISEENIWYVTVIFHGPFPKTEFSYPNFCVRSGIIEVRRVDPQITIQSFIGDFCKKVGNICKEKCQILDFKASFPSLQLHKAEDITEASVPRIGTTYTGIQATPYRSSVVIHRDNKKMMNKSMENGINLFPSGLQIGGKRVGNNVNPPLMNFPLVSYTKVENQNSNDVGNFHNQADNSPVRFEERNENPPNQSIFTKDTKSNYPQQAKYAPKFLPMKRKPVLTLSDTFPKTKAPRYAPTFHASKTSHNLGRSLSSSDKKDQNIDFKCNAKQVKAPPVKRNSKVKLNYVSAKIDNYLQPVMSKEENMKRTKKKKSF